MNAESGAGGVRDQLEQPSCWSNATMGIEVESTGNRAMTSNTRDFGYILSGHNLLLAGYSMLKIRLV